MRRSSFTSRLMAVPAAVLALVGATHAQNVVVNGSFEELTGDSASTTTFAGWLEANHAQGPNAVNSTVIHAGISGSNAATLSGPTGTLGALVQNVDGPVGEWQLDLDFAMADPGTSGDGLTERGLQLHLYHNLLSSHNLHLSVIDADGDGFGEVRVVSGAGTFNTILTDVVPFSIDLNGNGSFTDEGDVFRPVHLRITGNYDTTPSYFVTVGDSTSVELTAFQNAAPSGDKNRIERIAFTTTNSGTQTFTVDNVSLIAVPEPGSVALLSVGCVVLGFGRRRRK